MRPDEIPEITIRAALKRIMGSRGTRKDLDPETWVKEVTRATRGWTAAMFDQAVGHAIDHAEYFPTSRDIVAGKPQFDGGPLPATTDIEHCPACRQHYYYSGFEIPNGDVLGRLRCDCHQASMRWFTPAARAWQLTADTPNIGGLVGTPWHRRRHLEIAA